MQSRAIDNERAFDWGRTSADYARCRDICPPEFFRLLLDAACAPKDGACLDIDTGTGVLPRSIHRGRYFRKPDPPR